MTGHHIQKIGENWEYPNHQELLKKCGLLPIDIYIQRRRETLRAYLMECRKDLMKEAMKTRTHNFDVHKILWWEQKYLNKQEMKEMVNLWSD